MVGRLGTLSRAPGLFFLNRVRRHQRRKTDSGALTTSGWGTGRDLRPIAGCCSFFGALFLELPIQPPPQSRSSTARGRFTSIQLDSDHLSRLGKWPHSVTSGSRMSALLLNSAHEQWLFQPLPSPNGRYLAFRARAFDSNVRLLENF
jgi:hypothetical protein